MPVLSSRDWSSSSSGVTVVPAMAFFCRVVQDNHHHDKDADEGKGQIKGEAHLLRRGRGSIVCHVSGSVVHVSRRVTGHSLYLAGNALTFLSFAAGRCRVSGAFIRRPPSHIVLLWMPAQLKKFITVLAGVLIAYLVAHALSMPLPSLPAWRGPLRLCQLCHIRGSSSLPCSTSCRNMPASSFLVLAGNNLKKAEGE